MAIHVFVWPKLLDHLVRHLFDHVALQQTVELHFLLHLVEHDTFPLIDALGLFLFGEVLVAIVTAFVIIIGFISRGPQEVEIPSKIV